MKVTSEIPDVVNNGDFFDVVIVAFNDGAAARKVSRLGCFPDKREGQVVYAIANIAELLSDDPAGGDPDADFGQLKVEGNYAEFNMPGQPAGFRNIAPGETVRCKFRVAILSGGGGAPNNANEHYVQGHFIENNLTTTGPMQVSYVHERLNVV